MQLSHSVIVMAFVALMLQGSPDQVQAEHRVLDTYLGSA
jgi:ABC-type branched-subunit amino acid transport system ATPase component